VPSGDPDAAVIDLMFGVLVAASVVLAGFILVIGIDLWRIASNDETERPADGRKPWLLEGEWTWGGEKSMEMVPLSDDPVRAREYLAVLTGALGAALAMSAAGRHRILEQFRWEKLDGASAVL
jgi:hypothetical protein